MSTYNEDLPGKRPQFASGIDEYIKALESQGFVYRPGQMPILAARKFEHDGKTYDVYIRRKNTSKKNHNTFITGLRERGQITGGFEREFYNEKDARREFMAIEASDLAGEFRPVNPKSLELNGVPLKNNLPSPGPGFKKNLEKYFIDSVTGLYEASSFDKDLLKISKAVISELSKKNVKVLQEILIEKGCTSPGDTLAALKEMVEKNHIQNPAQKPMEKTRNPGYDLSMGL